jgi:hypothetical protein
LFGLFLRSLSATTTLTAAARTLTTAAALTAAATLATTTGALTATTLTAATTLSATTGALTAAATLATTTAATAGSLLPATATTGLLLLCLIFGSVLTLFLHWYYSFRSRFRLASCGIVYAFIMPSKFGIYI